MYTNLMQMPNYTPMNTSAWTPSLINLGNGGNCYSSFGPNMQFTPMFNFSTPYASDSSSTNKPLTIEDYKKREDEKIAAATKKIDSKTTDPDEELELTSAHKKALKNLVTKVQEIAGEIHSFSGAATTAASCVGFTAAMPLIPAGYKKIKSLCKKNYNYSPLTKKRFAVKFKNMACTGIKLGAGIEALMVYVNDWSKLSTAWKKDSSTGWKQTGQTTAKAAGAGLGWWGGAKLGAIAGTKVGALIGSVFPGAGNMIGAAIGAGVGALVGGCFGAWGGKFLAEKTVGKDVADNVETELVAAKTTNEDEIEIQNGIYEKLMAHVEEVGAENIDPKALEALQIIARKQAKESGQIQQEQVQQVQAQQQGSLSMTA